MAVDHVKSTVITNLDASPSIANTAGEGASAPCKVVSGYSTAILNSSQDATYQFVRVPSNAKVSAIFFESEAQGAGAMNIGLYYATDGQGGKPATLLVANTISAALFASAVVVTNLVLPTNVVNESGTNTIDKRNMPLWQAAGLTSDPGGSFDIVGTLSTAVTTGTGKWGMTVFYTD